MPLAARSVQMQLPTGTCKASQTEQEALLCHPYRSCVCVLVCACKLWLVGMCTASQTEQAALLYHPCRSCGAYVSVVCICVLYVCMLVSKLKLQSTCTAIQREKERDRAQAPRTCSVLPQLCGSAQLRWHCGARTTPCL